MLLCLEFGLSIPVFYKEIQKNPSCSYWERNHENEDKSFLYLIGTAAYVEINVIRLKEHFVNKIFAGVEASIPADAMESGLEEDEDEAESIEDELEDGADELSQLDILFENMKKLRKSINEYFFPHLDEVIDLERRMEEYNKNPLLNEFSLLKIKTRDLDCLLDHWIRKRSPNEQNMTYTVEDVNYDIQFIHSEEVKLLDKMAEKLDWFLSSHVLVNIVKSLLNSRGTVARQVERDLRQLFDRELVAAN